MLSFFLSAADVIRSSSSSSSSSAAAASILYVKERKRKSETDREKERLGIDKSIRLLHRGATLRRRCIDPSARSISERNHMIGFYCISPSIAFSSL